MKKQAVFTLLAVSLVTTGCAKKDNKYKTSTVNIDMPAMVNGKAGSYNVKADYSDGYFMNSAETFNKNLAVVSYFTTISTMSKENSEKFFGKLGFETCYFSKVYDEGTTEDTIGYYVAHKNIDNNDVFAISVRGYDYKQEWANNFHLGLSGDHEGFSLRAGEIYDEFKSYINTNYADKDIKLWITGYSRGGGVSNVLSYKILSSNELKLKSQDMFVYTFEAPQGLIADHAKGYKNVFNIVNEADAIPKIAPSAYGLFRCGTDINIYSNDVDSLLRGFDRDAKLPAFKASEGNYATDVELANYLINILLTPQADKTSTMESRSYFVANYQDSIRYALKMFFSLSDAETQKMLNKFQNMTTFELMALISKDGVYNFVKPYLDEDGVTYDDETLKTSLGKINTFLSGPGYPLRGMLTSYQSNLTRLLSMHYTEVNWVLLQAYEHKK